MSVELSKQSPYLPNTVIVRPQYIELNVSLPSERERAKRFNKYHVSEMSKHRQQYAYDRLLTSKDADILVVFGPR